MRVLVTGATGFIGSHLTRRLIAEGHEVAIVVRANSDTWRINDLLDDIFAIYETDLTDAAGIAGAVISFRPDAVFHLAAYYVPEHTHKDVPMLYNTNVLGTVNMLEACSSKTVNVRLFVNTSTCFVYGNIADRLGEADWVYPVNLYALTKVMGEQACEYYAKRGLNCVTLRLFPPYGEMDNTRKLIPSVIKSMLDGKELKLTACKQKWDYIYVGDIVDAYVKLLSMPEFKGHEIINIGTGHAPSLKHVVLMIKDIIGNDVVPEFGAVPYRGNEVMHACADTGTASKCLGWCAKTKLKDGLKKTVAWYRGV